MNDTGLTIKVKIYAPFQTYFEGDAASLSAVNATGPFDILPRHKNFISLLSPGVVTVRVPQRPDFNLQIEQGLMHVKEDSATVFLDI